MKKNVLILLLLVFSLSASANAAEVQYTYPDNPDMVRRLRQAGVLNSADLVVYDHKKKSHPETNNIENAADPLWKSAVEVISQMFPIEVLDPKMGLIVSDWSTPEGSANKPGTASTKRIKINVLVKKSGEDRVIVSVYKQNLNKNGMWESSHESQEEQAKMIKNKILERAKNYAR